MVGILTTIFIFVVVVTIGATVGAAIIGWLIANWFAVAAALLIVTIIHKKAKETEE